MPSPHLATVGCRSLAAWKALSAERTSPSLLSCSPRLLISAALCAQRHEVRREERGGKGRRKEGKRGRRGCGGKSGHLRVGQHAGAAARDGEGEVRVVGARAAAEADAEARMQVDAEGEALAAHLRERTV